MAATLSSSGTWTGLSTTLTDFEDTAKPIPGSITIHPTDLATIPDEIRQMIRLAQDGWGASIGAGKRLDFWCTVTLLEKFFSAYRALGVPRSGN